MSARRFVGLAFAVLIGLSISPVLAPMAAIACVNDGREAEKRDGRYE
jgi:hypothetical protein